MGKSNKSKILPDLLVMVLKHCYICFPRKLILIHEYNMMSYPSLNNIRIQNEFSLFSFSVAEL